MSAGRLREALASFDRAIDLYPSDAQAHNNRGLAKLKLGDVEGARTDWMRALELQPGMKEAEENLKRLVAAGAVDRSPAQKAGYSSGYLEPAGVSSSSRTLPASTSGVNGFCRKAADGSSASSVYPDM